jgi:hypothetical protein
MKTFHSAVALPSNSLYLIFQEKSFSMKDGALEPLRVNKMASNEFGHNNRC